jgi:hypothetical protein
MLHRNDSSRHPLPLGVSFKYDRNDVDGTTGFPYYMSFSISTFDESISVTENFPYVEPNRKKNRCNNHVIGIIMQWVLIYLFHDVMIKRILLHAIILALLIQCLLTHPVDFWGCSMQFRTLTLSICYMQRKITFTFKSLVWKTC